MLNERRQWSYETVACCMFTYESRFNMQYILESPWCLSSPLVSPRAFLLSQSYSLCICISPCKNATRLLIYSPSNPFLKLPPPLFFFLWWLATSDNSPAAAVLLLILLKMINMLLPRLLYFPLRCIHLLFSSHAKMMRSLEEKLLWFCCCCFMLFCFLNPYVSPNTAWFYE